MQRTSSGVGTAGNLSGAPTQQLIDQAWRPWVKLLEIAIQAADDAAWASAVPSLGGNGAPLRPTYVSLLDGAVLTPDKRRLRKLVRELLHCADDELEWDDAAPSRGKRLDVAALVQAAIVFDHEGTAAIAERAGRDAHALGAIGQLAAMPMLVACARAWKDRIPSTWHHGYCPVCRAWPSLVEMRGLDRSRRLRCGRCATDWPLPVLQCPYCNERDHEQLATLTPEGEPPTRRVEVCKTCHGYLKAFTTLRPMTLQTIATMDLESVDLDLVAHERGYARPAQPEPALKVTLGKGTA